MNKMPQSIPPHAAARLPRAQGRWATPARPGRRARLPADRPQHSQGKQNIFADAAEWDSKFLSLCHARPETRAAYRDHVPESRTDDRCDALRAKFLAGQP